MKNLAGKLPLIAFVVAVFAAVAFTGRTDLSEPSYGQDEEGWYLVDENTPPGSYQCELQDEQTCLYDDIEGNPLPAHMDRKFVNVSLTPITQ